MRTIWGYLKDYIREQNAIHLFFVSIFVAITIFFNYRYDIENGIIDAHYFTFKHFYLYLLLYTVGFVPIYLSYAYDAAGRAMLKQKGLWLRIWFSLIAFSLYCYFYQYRYWIESWFGNYYLQQIMLLCADQFFQASLLFILIFSFWFFWDRKQQRLYGFKVRGTQLKIYLLLLLAMVPLVVAASFTEDFQTYYPTAQRVLRFSSDELPMGWLVALYELCYAQEFLHIEFFFRGFLILGFVKFAGSRAILPAAVFYCFIHFGKPPVECISSFFGGIILGILSYRSQSIVAGVFVHLGIAMLMELVAGIWLWNTLF